VAVAQTRLRCEPVLADPPAEQITPTDMTKIDDTFAIGWTSLVG
jgi:hypothetical protein